MGLFTSAEGHFSHDRFYFSFFGFYNVTAEARRGLFHEIRIRVDLELVSLLSSVHLRRQVGRLCGAGCESPRFLRVEVEQLCASLFSVSFGKRNHVARVFQGVSGGSEAYRRSLLPALLSSACGRRDASSLGRHCALTKTRLIPLLLCVWGCTYLLGVQGWMLDGPNRSKSEPKDSTSTDARSTTGSGTLTRRGQPIALF